jgi:hypothetical protein
MNYVSDFFALVLFCIFTDLVSAALFERRAKWTDCSREIALAVRGAASPPFDSILVLREAIHCVINMPTNTSTASSGTVRTSCAT